MSDDKVIRINANFGSYGGMGFLRFAAEKVAHSLASELLFGLKRLDRTVPHAQKRLDFLAVEGRYRHGP